MRDKDELTKDLLACFENVQPWIEPEAEASLGSDEETTRQNSEMLTAENRPMFFHPIRMLLSYRPVSLLAMPWVDTSSLETVVDESIPARLR